MLRWFVISLLALLAPTVASAQTIHVTSPNGGESWQAGTTHSITWTDNITENVSIKLVNGIDLTITPSTPSTGSYSWTIPMSVPPSTGYQIEIRSVQTSTIVDWSDGTFAITGAIQVTSPNGGESWQAGTTHSITWTDNLSENVKIELYQGTSLHSTITSSTSSSGSYSWSIPISVLAGTNYKVKITSVNSSGINDSSDNYFTVTAAPYISVTSPNGGESWQAGTTHSITWNDNISENVSIKLVNGIDLTITSSTSSTGSYSWTIPLSVPPSTGYQIEIRSVQTSTIVDWSNGTFAITGAIQVTSPNGGESWQAGTSHSITWLDNISENVKIELYQGTSLHSTITSSTSSSGSYSWSIPTSVPAGTNYKVKVTSVNSSAINDSSDNYFAITAAPYISVVSPNGGESWQVGMTYNITWNDNLSETVSISLVRNGQGFLVITPGVPSTGSYSWTVPYSCPADNTYQIEVRSTQTSSIVDWSDGAFSITGGVQVTAPNGGESWQAGTTHSITWNDNIAENVKLELYQGTSLHSTITSSTSSSGTYSWTIPTSVPAGTNYKVKITSVNSSGINDLSDNYFTITEASYIHVTSPNGGENWQAGATYNITWTDNVSENVAISLVRNGQGYLVISSSTSSTGSYSWTIPMDTPVDATYQIEVRSVSNPSLVDWSDTNFTIYGAIHVTSPNGGESWQAGTTHNITWTDNLSENVSISLVRNGQGYLVISSSTPSTGSYTWTIPYSCPVDNTYQIEVRSVQTSTIVDWTDTPFGITGGIQVTAPNGGESWQAGTIHSITWNDNLTENVRIELYLGTTLLQIIATSTPSSGSYPWTIPSSLPAGYTYKVRIASVTNDGINDFSDGYFIVTDAAVIHVTSPNGGENWQAGTAYNITWTDNISENVSVTLVRDGQGYLVISSSAPSSGSFSWTIPIDTPVDATYQIEVRSVSNTNVVDWSDTNFTIYGAIHVTSPNGGESWQAGTTHNITWTDNVSENVSISLVRNGQGYLVISSSTPSTGSYAWTIPLSCAVDNTYQVEVRSVQTSSLVDWTDTPFSITGGVQVTAPNGGEAWQAGTTQSVTWNDNFSENVKIELYLGTTLLQIIAPSTPSSGSYPWPIPSNLPSGYTYKVRIASVNNDGVNDFSDGYFSVTDAAFIHVASPNGGETWQPGATYNITWADNISENVSISLVRNGQGYLVITNSAPSSGAYSWTIPSTVAADHTYQIEVRSVQNSSVADWSDGSFTITGWVHLQAPNGGEAWQTGTTQSITWSGNIADPVRLDLYQGSTQILLIAGSAPSSGSYSWPIPSNAPTGSDFKVKISSTIDPSASDWSDATFAIYSGALQVISPNGREEWKIGETHPITWAPNGAGTVAISLIKPDGSETLLASSVANSGSYSWTINTDLLPDNYRVHVRNNQQTEIEDTSDYTFRLQEATPPPASSFVSAQDSHLSLNGQDFCYVGTNCYYLMAQEKYGTGVVDEVLDLAADYGITAIRTMGFENGPNGLQTSPGVYDETYMEAMDRVIATAAEHNIKLIIPLSNFWHNQGGISQYIQWYNEQYEPDIDLEANPDAHYLLYYHFYTNEHLRQWYKDYVKFFLNRVNGVTHVTYKNDPTILAWELMNEPRPTDDQAPGTVNLVNWITEMSAYIKGVDSRHMVGVGAEGGYPNSDYVKSYEYFHAIHSMNNIDFCTEHRYPNQWWPMPELVDVVSFVTERSLWSMNLIGKPLLFEEYGMPVDEPTAHYSRAEFYDAILFAFGDNSVSGSNFWQLFSPALGPDPLAIYAADTDILDRVRTASITCLESSNRGACCSTSGHCTLGTPSDCPAPSSWQGAGILCEPDVCSTVGVPENEAVGVGFFGPVPNPMVEGVKVWYRPARSETASLDIFDPAGRLVRSFSRVEVGPSGHAFEWDRSDSRGARVVSGVYFARLKSASGSRFCTIVCRQ